MYAYTAVGAPPGRLLRAELSSTLVIHGARIIDGTGESAGEPSTITVTAGRIDSIGKADGGVSRHPPEGAQVIDARQAFVTPGLIDCHVHLTGTRGHDVFHRNIEEHPSIRLMRSIADANKVLLSGFTTVRHLGHGDAGQAEALKRVIADGLVAGPRVLTCGWAISQSGGHGTLAGWPLDLVELLRPRSAFADGADACRKLVRRNLGDGADCIKIYTTEGLLTSPDHRMDIPNFTAAEIEAVSSEAHRRGATVAAHATGLAGSISAIAGGADTLEHGPHLPDDELIQAMLSSRATLTPTLTVFEWGAGLGEEKPDAPSWVAERARRWLDGRQAMVRRAHEAGVPIATGTDSGGPPRGGSNANEMRALVRAGLSPLEALTAGTLDSARAIGLGHEVGSVEIGKLADLVLWEHDPTSGPTLADPADIRTVIQSAVRIPSPFKSGEGT